MAYLIVNENKFIFLSHILKEAVWLGGDGSGKETVQGGMETPFLFFFKYFQEIHMSGVKLKFCHCI